MPPVRPEQAAGLLSDLAERLVSERVPRLVRRSIIDEAVIDIGRTDLEDALCDVVYAASCNDDDLRYLAERLEGLNRASPLEHARRIYRRLGDREQYLALRTSGGVRASHSGLEHVYRYRHQSCEILDVVDVTFMASFEIRA